MLYVCECVCVLFVFITSVLLVNAMLLIFTIIIYVNLSRCMQGLQICSFHSTEKTTRFQYSETPDERGWIVYSRAVENVYSGINYVNVYSGCALFGNTSDEGLCPNANVKRSLIFTHFNCSKEKVDEKDNFNFTHAPCKSTKRYI